MAYELSEVAKEYVHFTKKLIATENLIDYDDAKCIFLILRTDEKLIKFMEWLKENSDIETSDVWEYVLSLDKS